MVVLPIDDLSEGGRDEAMEEAFVRALGAELSSQGIVVQSADMPEKVLGADRVSSAWGIDRASVSAAADELGATAVVIGVAAHDAVVDGPNAWVRRDAAHAAAVQWVNPATGHIEGMASVTAGGLKSGASSKGDPVADVARRLARALVHERTHDASGHGNLACIAVSPLANRTEAAGVGLLVSDLFGSQIYGTPGVGLLDRRELTDIFAAAEIPVPDWISPELAMDLSRVLGADALLHGIVDQSPDENASEVRLTLYLTDAAGEVRWFRAADVPVGKQGILSEELASAVRNAAEEIKPLTDPSGPGQRGCFAPDLKQRILDAVGAPSEDLVAVAASEPLSPADRIGAKLTQRQRGLRIKLKRDHNFALPEVSFDQEGNLLPESHAVLDDLVAVLEADTDLRLQLEGHVDNSGDPGRDQIRALGRALRVRAYLVEAGIDEQRVSARSRGSSRPLLPNITLRGRRKNRRIEVVLQN